MFWRVKFGKIALIRQIRQTLVMPNFRCLRYVWVLPSLHAVYYALRVLPHA